MILPKDLKQAIKVFVKYGGNEESLNNFVTKLVTRELTKDKKVSKPSKPKFVTNSAGESNIVEKNIESSGDVSFPTTNVDYTYPTLPELNRRENNRNGEPTEMQKELSAIAQDEMNNDTHKILLHLVHGGKYKIWLTCKQLTQLTLHTTEHESQTKVRSEIYKASNRGLIVQTKKNSKERKNVIHYALTDDGMSYMNKQTIGVQ